MSDRDSNGRFPPGVSGNPGGRVKGRPSVTKLLRLLLSDDVETWAEAKLVDAEGAAEGKGERLKLALNILRRSKFDNAMTKELLDRVDGKLAAAYTLPEDDEPARIIRPVLYVAPQDEEAGRRLFGAFYDAEVLAEVGPDSERPVAARDLPSDSAPSKALDARAEPPERFVQLVEVAPRRKAEDPR